MPIEFACPVCGGTLQVSDETAGRVIRCGGCMTALRVPDDAASVPASSSRESTPDQPPARSARRRRDPDDDCDRPRSDRPPPPPGRGVFFWLVVIGALVLVGTIGCCAGIFMILPGPRWQTHESERGKFKVELPGPPQAGVEKLAGLELERGEYSEGAIIPRKGEHFVVIYRSIPPTRVRAATDEQEITETIGVLQKATQMLPLRNDAITVNNFPAREVEFRGKNGSFMARVVVADHRMFVVLAGNRLSKLGPDAHRFLESFQITDPKLLTEGKRRVDQAREAIDAVRNAKLREAELAELREAAAAIADAVLVAARNTPPALEVAPPPRPVDD